MFARLFKKKQGAVPQTRGVSIREASGPNERIIVAIGDIHGRQDALESLLYKVQPDQISNHDPVRYIFLGDYIDRGANSSGVLDTLLDWQKKHDSVFLMGNHEISFLRYLNSPVTNSMWLEYGGIETALSYGVAPPLGRLTPEHIKLVNEQLQANVPPEHLAFLNDLQSWHGEGDFMFVHAGVYEDKPLQHNDERSLLWMREPFLSSERLFERVIVHGHTITEDFKPEVRNNRIGIDTGSYLNGCITALIIDRDDLRFCSSQSD